MELFIDILFALLVILLLSTAIYKEWLKYNLYNGNRMTFSEFIEYYYYPNLTRPFNKDKSYYEIQKVESSKINWVNKIQIIVTLLVILISLLESLY